MAINTTKRVRPANLTDSYEINKLSYHLGYGKTPDAVAHKRLDQLLKSPIDHIWVYDNGEQLLGWIHIFTALRVASSPFYEIGGLIVHPEERQQGIGHQLVQCAAEHAAQQGETLRVRCNSQRTEPHLFYQSIGFTLSKSQQVYSLGGN